MRRVGRRHAEIGEVDADIARIEEIELRLVEGNQGIGADDDALVELFFQVDDLLAFFVLQIESDVGADGHFDANDFEVVHGDGEAAHDVEAHAFGGFDDARAAAMGAVEINRPLEAGAHALAGEFDDSELAHPQDLGLGAVLGEILVKAFLEFAAMALETQVDEVADDDAAEIAKAKLAGNFVGGLHVGFEGGCFGVGVLAEFSAVDVDADDGLGAVDDERPAGGKRDMAGIHQFDFALDAVLVKQGNGAFVELDLVSGARIGELDDFLDALGDFA